MKRAVCPRCGRPVSHCLCPFIPSLQCRTRVTIVQHPRESRHPLNTARLVALGLSPVTLLATETVPREILHARGTFLLFPGPEALTPEAALQHDAGPPRHLIVPDGTWRMARALLQRNPDMAALPRLVLPVGEPSRYRVRNAHVPGALATIEAIVRSLNQLEAPACFDALLRPFDAMVDMQIDTMARALFARHTGN